MSPEQAEKGELTPTEQMLKDLNERFVKTVLKPGETLEIPPMDKPELALGTCLEQGGETKQCLRGALITGKEFLFLVDTDVRITSSEKWTADYIHSTVLSRYFPGHRAEILGVASKRDKHDIGTEPINHFDQDVVRPGTFIRVDEKDDGTVEITDRGSLNRIEVFTRKTPTEEAAEETLSPITGDIWSVDPTDLKAVVRSSLKQR